MLIEFLKLEKMPIAAIDTQGLSGKVARVIVNPEEVRVIGFLVKIGTILTNFKVLSCEDVVDIDNNGITIKTVSNLIERGEIVRIDKLLKYKFSLIGLRVKSKSGENLGRVSDALVEPQSGDILRIYVRSIFKNLIFERTRIVKMTLREAVVDVERDRKAADRSEVLGLRAQVENVK